MNKEITKTHNGVTYKEIASDMSITATTNVDNLRIRQEGTLKIQKIEGSYKYGSEYQILIYSSKTNKKAILEARNNSDWNTHELYFKEEEFREFLEMILLFAYRHKLITRVQK